MIREANGSASDLWETHPSLSSIAIQVGPGSVDLPSFEGLCGHQKETELEDHDNLEMLESGSRGNLWMVWEEGGDEERGKTSGDGCWMNWRNVAKEADADAHRPLCLLVAALWRLLNLHLAVRPRRKYFSCA